ncbi:MAG: glycosyltransferase family 4 protein [Lachnospiraceae bacterium]|nr:glycosyltransferase family 4 protein [Lachnospiraceae bacterium]MBQ8947993.1 glycosyltransferase family 4 protein [Lachnospiraceae bacterium]
MKKVLIDGRNFDRNFSGGARYAREIVVGLDSIIKSEEYYLIVDKDLIGHWNLNLRNISMMEYSSKNGINRYIELFKLCRRDYLYINLLNGMAVGKNNSIVTWHDLFPFYGVMGLNKYNTFKLKFKTYEAILLSKSLVTVSEYSKSTMIDKLHVNEKKITVIPNSWQHIISIIPDEKIIDEYKLRDREYYFFLGRLVRNKNIDWIFRIADSNRTALFVIAGALRKTEKFSFYSGKNNNIIYTGFITDEQMAALYMHCKAFLFPSLMEGFGIPPMEALYYGAPIIISNTSSLPEVYEDAAHYIDPYKYDYDLDEILKEPVADPQKILDKYSWEKSARQWYELIESFR